MNDSPSLMEKEVNSKEKSRRRQQQRQERKKTRRENESVLLLPRMPSVSYSTRKGRKRKERRKERELVMHRGNMDERKNILHVSTNVSTNPYDKKFPLTDDLIDDAIAFLTL